MQHTGHEPVNPVEHHVNGREYWRSLEQLADAPAMRDMISKEFPGYDADGILTGSRRKFLKLMGASLALAGLTLNGCRRWPQEKLVPYTSNPRDRMPGVPEQYATAMELGGVAAGLLVTSYDGRPIKIEGNPSHPYARTGKVGSKEYGAADALAQAAVLELYDPHRSTTVKDRTMVSVRGRGGDTPLDAAGMVPGRSATWAEFEAIANTHFAALRGNGDGFAILSEATASPSVLDMKKRLLAAFPQAKWFEYESLSRDSESEAAKLAFGQPLRTVLHLDQASTVLLLDADVLGEHPAHIRYASDWAKGRKTADDQENRRMSRIYLAETGFSITGTVADERLPVDPSRIYPLARAVASKLGVAGLAADDKLSAVEEEFVAAVAKDLQASGKKGLVVAGVTASVQAQALAHAINAKLGAMGTTVTLIENPTALERPAHAAAIVELADAMKGGKVSTLLILGGNPVYDAPADLAFADLLSKVPTSIHLGLYDDETSEQCKWHLPRAHFLESWGDARAWDGTAGVIQPLILPLYNGKSVIEVLALIAHEKNAPIAGEEIVRRTWAQFIGPKGWDLEFRRMVEAGVLASTAYKPVDAKVTLTQFPAAPPREQGIYVRFQAHGNVYDGRFAANGWLQETPESLTKLMWDNAALLSKHDADALGVKTGDIIRVKAAWGVEHEIAAYILPGQPVGVVGLPLGYGRTAAGPVGSRLGFNTYLLRDSKSPWISGGAIIGRTAATYALVSTQDHHIMDAIGATAREKRVGERHESGSIIHEALFADFQKDPRAARGRGKTTPLQLFEPPIDFKDPLSHQWGMSVDMNACIGCNACIVACQAENNIPIVGKDEASNHRAMHWIRIDRYFKGPADAANIEVVYQPMMCQHCENAPCEQVCPVAATMHDTEGLNTMVYNRCIGTRYCSNNCPYKVRRFNYFDYHSKDPRSTAESYLNLPDKQQLEEVDKVKRMLFNPDVTVRMRGVMEKCTFCVQRIHGTVIQKRNAGGDVVDGDIITACQESCPTQAIIFGNLNEQESVVSKNHRNVRTYGVLHEDLDTRPRTRYLAKLRNPYERKVEEKKV